MKVTRITLDADLGLIELKTGPGGDGNYVLLPIDVPPTAERYLRLPGEPCEADAPTADLRPGTTVSPDFVELISGGTLIAPGGWSVPADQAYDFNTTPGIGAYDAEIADPPRFERGGYKYPGTATAEKELNDYLAAGKDECDGNCGAHPVKKGREDDVWTRAPGEGEPSKERHTGPATVANPIVVIAHEHSRGYRLTCPALPHWRGDINQYDLYKVPGMVKEAIDVVGGINVDDMTISIIVKEMV